MQKLCRPGRARDERRRAARGVLLERRGLTGKTWQWTASTTKVPASQSVVPDPENYTIEFKSDGTLLGQGGLQPAVGHLHDDVVGRPDDRPRADDARRLRRRLARRALRRRPGRRQELRHRQRPADDHDGRRRHDDLQVEPPRRGARDVRGAAPATRPQPCRRARAPVHSTPSNPSCVYGIGDAHEGRRRQGDGRRRAPCRPGARGARQAHGCRAGGPRRARRRCRRRHPRPGVRRRRRDGRPHGRPVRAVGRRAQGPEAQPGRGRPASQGPGAGRASCSR